MRLQIIFVGGGEKMECVLNMKDIYKSFGNVEVLQGVNFSVKKGEVRGLLGANGAGKSTLIKIIGGVYPQTRGEIILNGKSSAFKNPNDAKSKGISIIYQELSLIPTLTVIENIFLGRELTNGNNFLDKKAMQEEYKKICDKFQFDIEPNIIVSKLSIAKQQMVEIMKAVSANSDIIIMDEPTTSLTNNEKESLFKIIKKLKSINKTIIYISHILEEIFMICDSASIMRNGTMVGTYDIKDLTKEKVAEMMTGKRRDKIIEIKDYSFAKYEEEPILEVRDVNIRNVIKNISFKVYKGEVVGLAGLIGSRRTEIINVIYGLEKGDSGEIILNGKHINITSPKVAIKNKIGLIPEDRKNLGLISNQEIYKNSTAINIDKMKTNGFLDKRKEIEFSKKCIKQLDIKANSATQKVNQLSGGNQQKVVVSKWIGMDLDLIIYDEPTKGIDIEAKEDIFKTIKDFSQKGVGIVFISSDLEEVIRVSDRILVVSDGTIIATIKNENITVQDLMKRILNV